MTDPVNLLQLSDSDFKSFLDSFDHVFSDCDGVIWTKHPLPGSAKFLELIKKHGKTVHFISNNSIRDRNDYETLFKLVNIENGYEHLIVPSKAIAEYLKSRLFEKSIYCVTCKETIKILQSFGLKCESGPHTPPEYYTDFYQFSEDNEQIGAVVFDSDFQINLAKMHKAITYLKRPEVIFISGATDRLVPMTEPGKLVMATGIFTDLVAEETKREPIVLGKPGKLFAEFAMKQAGVSDPTRVLFIGDMIDQDISLGKAIGFKTMLVLTNNTKDTMLSHRIKPDYYADSLGSLVNKL